MKVSRIIGKSICKACTTPTITFKLDKALTLDILTLLMSAGYKESPNFTKSGLIYVSTDYIIATGAFGSTNLQVSCKRKNCSKYIDELEVLLSNFG